MKNVADVVLCRTGKVGAEVSFAFSGDAFGATFFGARIIRVSENSMNIFAAVRVDLVANVLQCILDDIYLEHVKL